MRNKLFIKALAVSILLTLFSCSGDIKVSKNEEDILPPLSSSVPGYSQRIIYLSNSSLYEIITPKDTFLIFESISGRTLLLK